MRHSKIRLNNIYDRTSGYCHICHKKLARKNYAVIGGRAAWEVEHSKPKAKGGKDHLNNLYPACISCNRSKGKKSNNIVRKKNGVRIAPLSKNNRKKAKLENAITDGILYSAIGFIFGPIGAIIAGTVGIKNGYSKNPDKGNQ